MGRAPEGAGAAQAHRKSSPCSDASPIYNVLYREFGIVAVFCWAHVRRTFWSALPTDKGLATEALSIISKLFEVERQCALIAMPERTRERAERARPLLELLDAWIALQQGREDIGAPLQAAIGYYVNQRDGLRRFLEDGRLYSRERRACCDDTHARVRTGTGG